MNMRKQLVRFVCSYSLLLLMGGCSEEVMNKIDTDPNNPTDVYISLLIPSVTVGVPFNVSSTDLAWYSSTFVEQTAGVNAGMWDADRRENLNSQLSENAWANIYSDILIDLKLIIDKGSEGGSEEGNWHNVGVAQVLFAYTMFVMTDLFGRVPYSEALQGSDIRKPKFDTQEFIYQEMLSMLDSAIVNFQKEATTGIAGGDFIFGGDVDMWVKLAYSLKARHLNRLSNMPDSTTNHQEALAALANGFSDGEGFIFDKYSTSQNNQNPWFRQEKERGYLAVSSTLYNLMNSLNDPRIPLWFTKVQGDYNAAQNGTAIKDPSGLFYSRISTNVQYNVAPLAILTYDELKFIEAECHLRKSTPDPVAALAAYTAGVDAALIRAGVSSSAINSYKSQESVIPADPDDLTLDHIIKQKYIALWPYGSIEAFSEWRRTGIPAMTNPLGNTPRRFPYPQSELSSNAENVPDVTIYNGVWWDDGTED